MAVTRPEYDVPDLNGFVATNVGDNRNRGTGPLMGHGTSDAGITPPAQYYSPGDAYQHTGIAGYGRTQQQLLQDSMDRNMDFINQRAAYDQQIKGMTGGIDLSQGIWAGMDDYALTGAVGGLANSALGRQLQEALVRKYGSTDAMNNMINKYWAGFIDDPNNHGGFNRDYWQKIGSMNAQGMDTSRFLAAGANQHPGYNWSDYGVDDATRRAWNNTAASLKAQGFSGGVVPPGTYGHEFANGSMTNAGNMGSQGGSNNNTTTPPPPPTSPVDTGFHPTGPGYTNRAIGQHPLQGPLAYTNFGQ